VSAFHEVRWPIALALGTSGGPERRTEIVALASGAEERNSPWAQSRRRYDVGGALRSIDDIHAALAFFEARKGRLHGFRFRDPMDWKSCPPLKTPSALDQPLGVGTGAQASFALSKRYGDAGGFSLRPIAKPVAGTVMIAVAGAAKTEGTHFTLDAATGIVTFLPGAVPPAGAAVTAGFEFDTPVRFDADRLEIAHDAFAAGRAVSAPLVEIRP
jgi:uncharacterized protein (TIGR02217 family)